MATTFTEKNPRSFSMNERFERSYTRSFHVQTDNSTVGPVQIRAALAVTIGNTYSTGYEEDLGAVLLGMDLQSAADDGCQWELTLRYGVPGRDLYESPLDEPAQVDWDGEQFQRPRDQDRDGNAIVNSAYDPYDPPVMGDDTRPTLTVSRNQTDFSNTLAANYRDHVNSVEFLGWDPGTVKCSKITGRQQWHPNVTGHKYWQVTYVFQFDPDGWDSKPMDQGFRKIVAGARRQILIDSIPVTSPVPLNGAGGELAPGGTPVFQSFDIYPEADFNDFDFDIPDG